MPNELFLLSNARDDLILALTTLMNQIKDQQVFPECLRLCIVTIAYKNKGDIGSFDSYRGLFRTPVLKNTLDKLLYIDLWAKIIFGGKLRNPKFCPIFGMERLFFLLKKGNYRPGLGF